METAQMASQKSTRSRWRSLSAINRRRIVLGSLFAVALAARDLMLLMVASGFFALSELSTAPTTRPSPA